MVGTRKRGMWCMYFVSMYKNRRKKPVEVLLRREEGARENNGDGKSN
jgi:hypothetical protein